MQQVVYYFNNKIANIFANELLNTEQYNTIEFLPLVIYNIQTIAPTIKGGLLWQKLRMSFPKMSRVSLIH